MATDVQEIRPVASAVTRLAPSPTGALHLGNARTFLVNWALARQRKWRVVFRMEDLDGPRVKTGAAEEAIEDLTWLGLDWDGPVLYQRGDLGAYHEALATLHGREAIYPCTCTRKEIEAAQSAPHGDEHELRYPGTCRGRFELPASLTPEHWQEEEKGGKPIAWRVVAPPADEPIRFDDRVAGPQCVDVHATTGDFVVASKAGLPAYQLAVVVDDVRQGVTDVVRGDDLIRSTGRQLWLYRLLGHTPEPSYWHLPLVLGPDGRRLAKRHGDTRIAWYRQQGVSAQRIIGLLASWSGVTNGQGRQPMTASEFAEHFSIERMPRQSITLTQEDHAWLLD